MYINTIHTATEFDHVYALSCNSIFSPLSRGSRNIPDARVRPRGRVPEYSGFPNANESLTAKLGKARAFVAILTKGHKLNTGDLHTTKVINQHENYFVLRGD